MHATDYFTQVMSATAIDQPSTSQDQSRQPVTNESAVKPTKHASPASITSKQLSPLTCKPTQIRPDACWWPPKGKPYRKPDGSTLCKICAQWHTPIQAHIQLGNPRFKPYTPDQVAWLRARGIHVPDEACESPSRNPDKPQQP